MFFRNPLHHSDFVYNLTPSGRKFNKNSRIVADKADEIIRKRKQALLDQVIFAVHIPEYIIIRVFSFFFGYSSFHYQECKSVDVLVAGRLVRLGLTKVGRYGWVAGCLFVCLFVCFFLVGWLALSGWLGGWLLGLLTFLVVWLVG